MSGSNPGFSSNKPTHYLLDHGDFNTFIHSFFSNVCQKLCCCYAIKLLECQKKKKTFGIQNTQYSIALSVHKQQSVCNTTYLLQSCVNYPIVLTVAVASTASLNAIVQAKGCIIIGKPAAKGEASYIQSLLDEQLPFLCIIALIQIFTGAHCLESSKFQVVAGLSKRT